MRPNTEHARASKVPSECDQTLCESDIGLLPINVNLGVKCENLESLGRLVAQRRVEYKKAGQRRRRVERRHDCSAARCR